MLWLSCLWGAGASASTSASEASLRVAFVFNFSKFIEWPQGYGEVFNLCAFGADDTMQQALEPLAKQAINKHPIAIHYLDNSEPLAEAIASCQILYWPSSGKALSLIDSLPKGVVLVVDEASSTSLASITLMRNDAGRMEFSINQQALSDAGVVVSSQLLKLAKNYQAGSQ